MTENILYSGVGFGTYYYDIEQVEACGANFGFVNQGIVECNQHSGLSLNELNSNYVVAMNNTQLATNFAAFCGRRVVVTVDGVQSDLPLFIGDGCQRCGVGSADSEVWNADGAPGLDFSYSVLSELSSLSCQDGHIDISWKILDETLYEFDTNKAAQTEAPSSSCGTP